MCAYVFTWVGACVYMCMPAYMCMLAHVWVYACESIRPFCIKNNRQWVFLFLEFCANLRDALWQPHVCPFLIYRVLFFGQWVAFASATLTILISLKPTKLLLLCYTTGHYFLYLFKAGKYVNLESDGVIPTWVQEVPYVQDVMLSFLRASPVCDISCVKLLSEIAALQQLEGHSSGIFTFQSFSCLGVKKGK